DLLITTYALLARDAERWRAVELHYLVLDEAQHVKNPRARAAQVVRGLTARHRLCLTGTPLENHLGELWTQFDFLMPGFLGDAATFRRCWRTPIERHGDDTVATRLKRRVAPFLLRRTKRDVAPELPPKSEIVHGVAFDDAQAEPGERREGEQHLLRRLPRAAPNRDPHHVLPRKSPGAAWPPAAVGCGGLMLFRWAL
ncbi:MAG: hypothetical protein KDC98_23630, partial [Planctomycetes bacterium]|nr:hypothetical protein [Planctomycetota bacterium]